MCVCNLLLKLQQLPNLQFLITPRLLLHECKPKIIMFPSPDSINSEKSIAVTSFKNTCTGRFFCLSRPCSLSTKLLPLLEELEAIRRLKLANFEMFFWGV